MPARQYALFHRVRGRKGGRWVRLLMEDNTPYPAYNREHAVRIYQDILLNSLTSVLEVELRAIPNE